MNSLDCKNMEKKTKKLKSTKEKMREIIWGIIQNIKLEKYLRPLLQ